MAGLFPTLAEVLGLQQLATQQTLDYQPNVGTRMMNESAGRRLSGDLPMLARKGTDMEAMRRQLQAQIEAAMYFDQQQRTPGGITGAPGQMALPSGANQPQASPPMREILHDMMMRSGSLPPSFPGQRNPRGVQRPAPSYEPSIFGVGPGTRG